jgi:hypothetical protein
MDGGVGDCKRRIGVVSAGLYRVEFAVLGGWRVDRDDIGVILYE